MDEDQIREFSEKLSGRIASLEERNDKLLEAARRVESEKRYVETELQRLQKEIRRLKQELDRLKSPRPPAVPRPHRHGRGDHREARRHVRGHRRARGPAPRGPGGRRGPPPETRAVPEGRDRAAQGGPPRGSAGHGRSEEDTS